MKVNNIMTAIAVSLMTEGCSAANKMRGLVNKESLSVASGYGGASRVDADRTEGEDEADELTVTFTQNAVATILNNLSPAQLEQALIFFDDLDKNGDGILQWVEALQSDAFKPLLREHDNWKDSDKNGQAGLTFEEFLEWLVRSDAFAPPPVVPQDFLNKLIMSDDYSDGLTTIVGAFSAIDVDVDGVVTAEELDAYFAPTERQEHQYIYNAMVDGTLELESFFMAEMQTLYPNSLFGDSDATLVEFKALDSNADGYLGYDDLSELLPVRQVDGMIKAYDYNGDGRVGFAEYFVGTTLL